MFEVKYTIKNSSLTFNKLLENTKKNIGDDNFSNYDPHTNKCRVFLLGVLNGVSYIDRVAGILIPATGRDCRQA